MRSLMQLTLRDPDSFHECGGLSSSYLDSLSAYHKAIIYRPMVRPSTKSRRSVDTWDHTPTTISTDRNVTSPGLSMHRILYANPPLGSCLSNAYSVYGRPVSLVRRAVRCSSCGPLVPGKQEGLRLSPHLPAESSLEAEELSRRKKSCSSDYFPELQEEQK